MSKFSLSLPTEKKKKKNLMDSLAKCYKDDLDMTLPLKGSEVSVVKATKKSRCLQRAKRIDKSLRFEEEDEEMTQPLPLPMPLPQKERLKPRKVVRFQLENNKIIEPNKPVRFGVAGQELEPKEKPLGEKEVSSKVEEKEEVVRVKIKMTKQEAQRLLAKCKNDSVLDFEHVVEQIVHGPVHQLQVGVVVIAFNNDRKGNGCWLSQLE